MRAQDEQFVCVGRTMATPSYLHASQLSELAAPVGDTAPLTSVQVDGLVVLKIIKHCQDHLPVAVTGLLLGLDVVRPPLPGVTVEVTNCFPFPTRTPGDDEESEAAGAEYQLEMMHRLREVNIDNNTVGWYTSTYLETFLSDSSIVETQLSYQTSLPRSVLLVFDPVKTAQGTLSLRAYRLTQSFVELYQHKLQIQQQQQSQQPQANTLTESSELAHLSFNDIFYEIPIRIHNSQLINALLYDMEGSDTLSAHFERLNLGFAPFLEKNLEYLAESLDDLAAEQSKYLAYQRNLSRQQAQIMAHRAKKAAEGGGGDDDELSQFKLPQQPFRADSLLITNQINKYCEQINKFAGTSFTKLFLYAGIQK